MDNDSTILTNKLLEYTFSIHVQTTIIMLSPINYPRVLFNITVVMFDECLSVKSYFTQNSTW